jgi:phosphoribosylglycinamide formyltransferase-1
MSQGVPKTFRIVILASGSGTLAQAIIDAVASGVLEAEIVSLISDQPTAPALIRAQSAGIETFTVAMFPERRDWDREMQALVAALSPDLVVSAGFMRILAPTFVAKFKVINSHPALLPKYPGAHAVRDALADGATVTGTTIHWVDAGVDTGQVIAQQEVEILASDTEDSLHERIKIAERSLLVKVIIQLVNSRKGSDG